MRVSINGVPNSWMVYKGKSYYLGVSLIILGNPYVGFHGIYNQQCVFWVCLKMKDLFPPVINMMLYIYMAILVGKHFR